MVCPKCGSTVLATDHFCESCGNPIVGAVASGSASAVQVCHCPPGQSKPDEAGYCQVCGVRCVSEAVATRKHVEQAIDERLAVVSDIGRRHAINEDAGAVTRGADGTIVLVVADGVSTAPNSASASTAAVEATLHTLASLTADTNIAAALRSAIDAANQAVIALPLDAGKTGGPETTIVAALCRGDSVAVGWSGDSRAYLVSADGVKSLTVDDSWVEEVVRSGQMSREQAIVDRRAHYVTQVLGMRDQPLDVHVVEGKLPAKSILLLCSDGLWNYFQDESDLARALRQCDTGDALSLCRCLVDAANNHGGHDNVTVAALVVN